MSGAIATGPAGPGSGSAGGRAAAEEPTPEAVRAELERVLASPGFTASDRLGRFLRFVVDETLVGRASRIKAFTVAVEVFGRDERFDPQNDPVVRLEATRLRRALEHYYLAAGWADPVRIDIPRGGYVPTFRSLAAPPAAPGAEREPPPRPEEAASPPSPRRFLRSAPGAAVLLLAVALGATVLIGLQVGRWTADDPGAEPVTPPAAVDNRAVVAFADRPSLVVLPFANLSGDPEWDDVARGLAEEILIDLTRFKELVVFGRDTGFSYDQGADVRRIGRDVGVRYVLRGSLRRSPDSGIRVTGELLDAPTGAMLWAESYDRDLTTADLFAIQDDLAREVATAVAQPYGIIFREDSKRSARRPPEDLAAYDCSLRFYAYRADVAPEAHAAVRACLERAVAREPGYAAGWAMLAVLYLDEDRYLFNRRPDRPALDRALEAAKRAADLGPDDARAQQALMLVHFFRGQPDEGLAAGERALALNPNDTEVMAELGGRLVLMSGQRERGEALLREALARNPGHTGFYHATLAVGLYLDGRYREAAEAIERANQPELPIVHGVAAMIYGQLGRREDARAAGREFMERLPTFVANIGAELRRRNLSPSDQFHMLDGLRKAGVPIPEGALDDDVAKHGKEGRGAPRTRTNINKMSGRHRRVGASDTVLEQSHAELSSLAAGPFHRNRRKDDSHVGST